jgi:deoxyribodipyrimidine photo-lyase
MYPRRWRAGKKSNGAPTLTQEHLAPERTVPLSGSPISVVWHKWSDLRLADHEPLVRAHAKPGFVLHVHLVELPLLCGFSRIGKVPRCSARRAAFWQECVSDLADRLAGRNQRLLVCAVEKPADFFSHLCAQIPVASVFAHREFCDEELQTEAAVRQVLKANDAVLETCWGGLTVHHIDDLGFDPSDPEQMPWYKGEFQRAAKRRPVREALPIPGALRPSPDLDVGEFGPNAIKAAFASALPAPPPDERRCFNWVGGETAAVAHLTWYMETGQLSKYRGATESFAHGEDVNPVNSGTRLSPWLAFGCISARKVIHEARAFERSHGKASSTGKGSGKSGSTGARLHTELIFRDFLRFSTLSWGTSLFKIGGPFEVKGIEWGYNRESFAKWCAGETGFPFVDAGMRELATTGYMSHLHRQCCAAFLVRDLRLDWRMGAEHFESCLLDHTPDANWGNWAYRILQRPCLAETRAKYAVEDHISTVECVFWPLVHDPRLEHTLCWLPELKKLGSRDLAREPWRTDGKATRRIKVAPYKDSPLWFCAANRTNWSYEYFWLPGHAWIVQRNRDGRTKDVNGFRLGHDYPYPMVPALNVEIDLDTLPVKSNGWGDTVPDDRPHVWGKPGNYAGRPLDEKKALEAHGPENDMPRLDEAGRGFKGMGKKSRKGSTGPGSNIRHTRYRRHEA